MSQLDIRAQVNDYLGTRVGVSTSIFRYWLVIVEYRELGVQIPLGLVDMGVEHSIVCIDCFGVLICTMGDVLWLCEYMHDRMCKEIVEH